MRLSHRSLILGLGTFVVATLWSYGGLACPVRGEMLVGPTPARSTVQGHGLAASSAGRETILWAALPQEKFA